MYDTILIIIYYLHGALSHSWPRLQYTLSTRLSCPIDIPPFPSCLHLFTQMLSQLTMTLVHSSSPWVSAPRPSGLLRAKRQPIIIKLKTPTVAPCLVVVLLARSFWTILMEYGPQTLTQHCGLSTVMAIQVRIPCHYFSDCWIVYSHPVGVCPFRASGHTSEAKYYSEWVFLFKPVK